jgi:hypothetical protein
MAVKEIPKTAPGMRADFGMISNCNSEKLAQYCRCGAHVHRAWSPVHGDDRDPQNSARTAECE